MRSTGHHRLQLAGAITLVLLIGVGIRLWGIRHGAPDVIFHPDVGKLAKAAFFAYEGSFNPARTFGDNWAFSAYPYGFSILLGGYLRLQDAVLPSAPRPPFKGEAGKWYWALKLRYGAVVLFAGAVLAVLLWLSRHCSIAGVLVTGLLLVLEPMNAQYSHYGMNDVPLTALLLLAWLAASGIPGERASLPVPSALAGIFLGLGFGIKYQALLGGALLLVPWISLGRDGRWGRLAVSIPACGLGALLGAVLTCPGLMTPTWFLPNFLSFMQWQSRVVDQDITVLARVWQSLQVLARMVRETGHWLLLASLIPWLACRRSGAAVGLGRPLMGAAVFSAGMVLTLTAFRAFPRSNDLLPVWPFLIVMAGILAYGGEDGSGAVRLARPHLFRRGLKSICVGLALWFGVHSTLDSRALAGTDTRLQARQWCRERVKPGDLVLREHYTLPIETPRLVEKSVASMTVPTAKRRLLSGQYDYAIFSSLVYERFFDPLSPYYDKKRRDFYSYVFENYPLRAEFRERPLYFANPVVRIYGTPKMPYASDQEEPALSLEQEAEE